MSLSLVGTCWSALPLFPVWRWLTWIRAMVHLAVAWEGVGAVGSII